MVRKTKNTNETPTCSMPIIHNTQFCNIVMEMVLFKYKYSDYVLISWRARTAANHAYWLHALFIYLIPEDVLSDFSTIFGVTGAL